MKRDLKYEMFIIAESTRAIIFDNVEQVLGIKLEIVKTSSAKTSSPQFFSHK